MKKLGFFLAIAFCLAAMATMAVGQIAVAPGTGFNLDGQGTGIYSTRPTGADLTAGLTEVVLQVITHDSTGAAIDLDLDGNREIVVQTCGSNAGAALQTRLYIFEAEANNDFRQRSTVLIDAGTNDSGFGLFRGVDIGNLDGDLDLEIVAASGTGTNSVMTIYDVNTSTFAMTELVQRPVFGVGGLFTTSGTVSQMRILPNKNGGPFNDIIISNATGASAGTHLFAVEYTGIGTIAFVNTTGTNSGTVVNSGVISFNHGNFGDASDEEIVMATESATVPLAIREYVTHATAPFGTAKTITTNWAGTTGGSLTTVAIADLDGDSDLDAVINDYNGLTVRAVKRTGVDTYTSEAILAAPLAANPRAVEISDFDSDGRREVVYSNGTSVVYREHDGTIDSFASANFGAEANLLTGLGAGTANAISYVGGTSTTLDNDLNFDFVVGRSVQGTDTDMDSDEIFFLEADRSFAGGSIPAGSYDNLAITADTSLGGSVTVRGTFGLTSGLLSTGGNTLTIDCTGSISGASSTTYVIGNLKKNYCGAGVKAFEVGTLNGYSPVSVNVTAGTFPANFTVAAVQGPQPNVNAATSLQRYWTLTEGGDVTASLNFNYLDPTDIAGVEANYHLIRVTGGVPVAFPLGACPIPPANTGCVNTGTNEASITDVTTFSDWTLGEVAPPTASDGVISGTITDSQGAPIAGTVIHLSGTQNRKFITAANGYYRFDNVDTTGFYTVTPSRANYGFNPGARSFSQLGNNTEATFTAEPLSQNRNPLDTPEYFVRQHYLDFLGREPDEVGFNFWSDQILECGADAGCIERRTINVSAAYFLSIEFQRTGGLVDRLYRASFGRDARYAEFIPDRALIAHDVRVGRDGWEAQLAANEDTFVDNWVARPAFRTAFDSLSNAQYVDHLLSNTGVSFAQLERDAFVSSLNGGTSRADVLQQIAGNENFAKTRFNEAFVLMEYFGYLRRDPDEDGYQYWLGKLNQFDGNFERAEMVKAFINSIEYRARFVR